MVILHEPAKEIAASATNERPLYVLDTFAGTGGFSLGFSLAGYTIVGAIELDEWASETFASNHPSAIVLTRDMQTVTNEELLENYFCVKPEMAPRNETGG